ncbi:hypothetical protein PROFUN_06293 [Planoprotostelium fungivorum]|uniref:MYND-type domain-containing protein n=1 Tax=Planoprotostelium fungivorum TaxID=1890364 RepID=A0A2P6NEB9_9EUKA|nr:hypothetical protein PROFUN_06293 [Planoprotostelium fungivorum]
MTDTQQRTVSPNGIEAEGSALPPTSLPLSGQTDQISVYQSMVKMLDDISEKITKAREAAHSTEMRAVLKASKMPLGIEDITENEKGDLLDQKVHNHEHGLQTVINLLKNHFERRADEKKNLMKLIGVERLVVPTILLDLPAEIILAYNKMEEEDPLVAVFRLHPLIGEEVYKFGLFLDRYDTNKEVICSLVWSLVDNMVIFLPQVGLNPYPICWLCEKHFGVYTCSKCGVAKYCSKTCQVQGWTLSHKAKCAEMQRLVKEHSCVVVQPLYIFTSPV